jgi:hypothetical protein
MHGAVTSAQPRDFTVLLPPGWVRIPLDGREGARAAALAGAKAAGLPAPQREQAREKLTRLLLKTLRAARQAGGLDVMVSLARSHGVPLAASCLVTYQDRDGDLPLDELAAELADGASLVEIAGRQAVRHRSADSEATRLDYIVPVPGRAGLLTLSFATPAEPLADALVNLFDAIAGSLRWQP